MSKGKRKRKPHKVRKDSARRPQGYDFGSSELCFLVASFDFIEALSKGDIFACAYGEDPNNVLRIPLLEVSLIGKDADSLKSAFQEFKRWGADEDGDVVALTFVFLRDGGYLLGIGHDVERLKRRLGAYDRVLIPLPLIGTWVKKFDSRNPMLEQLADYKKSLISPFLFSAAIHPTVSEPANLNFIRPLQGLEPILKFEASFTREEDVQDHSEEWAVLQTHRSKESTLGTGEADDGNFRPLEPPPMDDPHAFLERRHQMLSQQFPITLARARRSKRQTANREKLIALGVRPWQIDQAICNIVLSREICGKDHYIGLSKKEFRDKIISALQGRFEQADGQDHIDELTLDAIHQQIELDCKVLLGHFKIRPKAASLRALVEQLTEEGLLGD